MGVEGEAGSLLCAIAACWESEADNTGQDEKGGSCRQVEGAVPGSAVSHRGEEEEGGRTEGRSPLDSGFVVCKRTPLNRTEFLVDEKRGTLGVVGRCRTASLEEEGWEVEVSAWISGRPPGPEDTPPSVVASSPPRSTSAWMKDDGDVELPMSPRRDATVVVEVLYEEILLPPFVLVLVNVGIVVLTPPLAFSGEYFGMPPFVFESEYKGVVEVEMLVVVEKKGALPLKSALPLISGSRVTSAGCMEALRCTVSSEGLKT